MTTLQETVRAYADVKNNGGILGAIKYLPNIAKWAKNNLKESRKGGIVIKEFNYENH